ncbi:hypothetical protein ACFL4O_00500 [bacterium]
MSLISILKGILTGIFVVIIAFGISFCAVLIEDLLKDYFKK